MKERMLKICLLFLLVLYPKLGAFADSEDKKLIRMGIDDSIFSGLSPGDAKLAMLQIVQLAGFKDHQMDATFYPDETTFSKAIQEGEIDFFPILTPVFLELKEEIKLDAVAAPIVNGGKPFVEFVLLSKTKGVNLGDLKGKSILVDDSIGHGLERIWLETISLEAGLESPEKLFGEYNLVEKSNQALLSVFFGKVDCCLVSQKDWEILAELNPQLKSQLHVVAESDPLLTLLLAFRADYDSTSKERFVREVAKIHESTEGKQILTLSRSQRIDRYDPKWMKSVEALLERHQVVLENKLKEVEK